MAILESKKSSNDIINNQRMSDDEEVGSDVPRVTCSEIRPADIRIYGRQDRPSHTDARLHLQIFSET